MSLFDLIQDTKKALLEYGDEYVYTDIELLRYFIPKPAPTIAFAAFSESDTERTFLKKIVAALETKGISAEIFSTNDDRLAGCKLIVASHGTRGLPKSKDIFMIEKVSAYPNNPQLKRHLWNQLCTVQ